MLRKENLGLDTESLQRFFSRLVAQSFRDLRIPDQRLHRYVSRLLARFAHMETLHSPVPFSGEGLETIVEMLLELEAPKRWRSPHLASEERERAIRRHIGDYTLFMSGIFRPFVERRGILDLYLMEGEKSYRTTAALDRQLLRREAEDFERLAQKFEVVSGALDYMRRVYFLPETGEDFFPPGPDSVC